MSVSQTFEIVIDASLVSPQRLEELVALTRDFSAILQDVGGAVEGGLQEWFDTQGDGSWAALRPSTVKDRTRKGYAGHPDLVRTGELRAALTERGAPGHKFVVGPQSVEVGVYGTVPQSVLARPGKNRPARILAAITPDAQERIIQILTDWLGGGAGVRVVAGVPQGVA